MVAGLRGRSTDMSDRGLLVLLLGLAIVVNILVAVSAQNQQLYLGDNCPLENGGTGLCKRTAKCPYAKRLIENGKRPQVCYYERNAPIVCCPPTSEPLPSRISTRPRPQPVKPPVKPHVKPNVKPHVKPEKMTAGKSWPKCMEYGKEVYREVEIPTLTFGEEKVVEADCAQAAQELIINGKKCKPKEFPHMAALGFGDDPNIAWLCGGSLISKDFVLTAAHCLYTRGRGKVKWVQLGDLNLHSTSDDSRPQRLPVIETIPHPEYKPPSHYHDIALLRLSSNLTFSAYVRPACLNTNPKIDPLNTATATGWGVTEWASAELSEDLMKVDLKFHTARRCNETFKSLITSSAKLVRGFTGDTMICAGDTENKRDTCVGDSGGPLQQTLTTPFCMYNIVGLTSFGSRACGESNSPAVYTRVSYYIPWIEGIVWP